MAKLKVVEQEIEETVESEFLSIPRFERFYHPFILWLNSGLPKAKFNKELYKLYKEKNWLFSALYNLYLLITTRYGITRRLLTKLQGAEIFSKGEDGEIILNFVDQFSLGLKYKINSITANLTYYYRCDTDQVIKIAAIDGDADRVASTAYWGVLGTIRVKDTESSKEHPKYGSFLIDTGKRETDEQH